MGPILVPSTQPVAAFTASRRLSLLSTEDKTGQERIPFTRGIEIVGVKITVSANAANVPGPRDPTIDDIEVRIESEDMRLTRDASDDADVDTFADASALTLPLRYINAVLRGSPDVTVQARWKSALHQGIFNDCLVSISILYNWEKP